MTPSDSQFVTIMACDIVGYSLLKAYQQREAKAHVTKLLEASTGGNVLRSGWADAGDGGYLLLGGKATNAYDALETFVETNASAGAEGLQFRFALHQGIATPQLGFGGATEWQSTAINQVARLLNAMSKDHTGQIVISGLYRETLEDELAPDGRAYVRLNDVIDKHKIVHQCWNLRTGRGFGVEPAAKELFTENSGGPASPTIITNLRTLPTQHFVEITEHTAALDAALIASNAAVLQAVQGMGGVGKTTLAIHYGMRAETIARFPVRWLVNAETNEGVARDLVQLAAALGLADDHTPQDKAVQMAQHWLAAPDRPALVIFDNAEDDVFDRNWLPAGPATAAVLVTTRQRDFAGLANPISIGVWSIDRATAFLLDRSGSSDEKGAEALAQELGGLALACEQAGAFCAASGETPSAYLDLLRAEPAEVLAWKQGAADYPNSVAQTFTLAIDRAVTDAPAAEAMLEVMGQLSAAPLPHAVFGHAKAPKGLRTGAEAAKARMALTRWGLADQVVVTDAHWKKDIPALHLHRLTRRAAQVRATEGALDRAVMALGGAYPDDVDHNLETWPLCNALAPHVDAEWGEEEWSEEADGASRALNQAAIYEEYRTANHRRAQILFEAALKVAETAHGADATEVATQLSNLANIFTRLGGEANLTRAQDALERALRIDEAAHGQDHPNVAIRLSNLATVLSDLGGEANLIRAREALERALRIGEAAHGQDHPNVAIRLSNLANVLRDLGGEANLTRAREALERAIRIDEAAHGPDHPNVAIDLSNLANVLRDLGGEANLTRAREALERALRIDEAAYGPDHPNVGIRCVNLASVLMAMEDPSGALALARRGHGILLAALGPEHGHTAVAAKRVAELEGGG